MPAGDYQLVLPAHQHRALPLLSGKAQVYHVRQPLSSTLLVLQQKLKRRHKPAVLSGGAEL